MGTVADLRAVLRRAAPRIVAIDGLNGAGKTTRVAAQLEIPVVSIDDFLVGDGRYLSGLKLDALSVTVRRHTGQFAIEGCCALAVLSRLQLRADLHVYVRRTDSAGQWLDAAVGMGDDLEHQLGELEDIRRAASIVLGELATPDQLAIDLIRYHAQYRPFQAADLVVDVPQQVLTQTS